MSSVTGASFNHFSRARSLFFPVHRHEWQKFFPMMAMLCLICFNYTVLRNTKDVIVVTASGAEVIPFIKVWVVLPAAVLIAFLFTRLTNRYSQERVFYIMISSFLIFYALYGFLFYPNRESLQPQAFANLLTLWLPNGCTGLINMLRHWPDTCFYVLAELWSSIIMSTLFWGFANEITKLDEARRFYGVLSIVGNGAGILASGVSVLLGYWVSDATVGDNQNWEFILQMLIGIVICSGLLTMAIFRWMNHTVLQTPEFNDLHHSRKALKMKSRLSLKQSIAYLSNSSYLIYIATIVISYNLVINLIEVVWKDKLYQLYPSPVDYNRYMAYLTIATCLLSSIAALFMPKIIESFGWTKTALITPIVALITGIGFFGFLHLQDINISGSWLLASPLAMAVFFGAAQNCLVKGAKYSVFDTTQNMAFIPLEHDTKLKGKAAIDGVGSRLGKSGGAFIHQGLLMVFEHLGAITSYVAIISMGAITLWIFAVKALGRDFNALAGKEPEQVKQDDWVTEKEAQPVHV